MPLFSYSKINAFRNCPKAYEFRYVLRERERFSTIERHMGTTVHEALRWAHERRSAGEEPESRDVVARYDEQWWTGGLQSSIVVKRGLTQEDYRLDGRSMVEAYVDGIFRGDASRTIGLELKFRVDLRDGLTFNGIIDRLGEGPDGRLKITDYKTGRRVPSPSSDPQLAYYALHVFDSHAVDEVDLAYVDLRNAEEKVEAYGRYRAGDSRRKLLGDIDIITAAETFDPQPSILCNWCGFNPICEAAATSSGAATSNASTGKTTDPPAGSASCPDCAQDLRARTGKFGSFIGCSGYPGCRYTRDRW